MARSVNDRFRGCLMGLALGDAIGARFEGLTAAQIRSQHRDCLALTAALIDALRYTDDTQMAIGIAETLVVCGRIDEETLRERFAGNYAPSRGYGLGSRAVLDAMSRGGDYRAVASEYFPGGSYGNGAAMRVAPVGIFFRHDHAAVLQQSQQSAVLTHLHPLAIEGAQLLALAVAMASQTESLDRPAFFEHLESACRSRIYRDKLALAADVAEPEQLGGLGNGTEAFESVPTAIACFSLFWESYEETVANAVLLGGDTDTIAAMAGALTGSLLGEQALPQRLQAKLEDSLKGRSYIQELADDLCDKHLQSVGRDPR